MSSKIWLSSPHMGGNELDYIQQAFDANWVAPLGPNVNGFEDDLEKRLSPRSVAALSSGTAALHLALIRLGVGVGDEVICQSMTFSASANPIAYQGAVPVFVDSEADTWNCCPKALEQAIQDRIKRTGRKPKAIIIVHLYGMPAKMDELIKVAAAYDIPLIEDAAEALGSTYQGKACGTFGTFGVLSFNGNKIITTSGGGALACPTPQEKERVVFLATQARDEAVHYQHSEIGYNYRMSNISAGIGRGQMEVLEDRIAARRGMHSFYQQLLGDKAGVSLLTEPDSSYYSNHWLTAIQIDPRVSKNGVSREDLRLAFQAQQIESRPVWKPMHLQPVFAESPFYQQADTAVCEILFEFGLCLPSGSNLTDADRSRIEAVIESVFK